ncbi:MAG TPA: hypothetical protein VH877_01280 [Polyangia bacterium]|nr:hypothetical protein [Polyangia bacterium]
MSTAEPALSVLILSEDKANNSFDTVLGLTRTALRLVDPAHDPRRIRFEPLADEGLRRLIWGNGWKSQQREDRKRIVDVVRRIAGTINEQRPGFVVFHVDGDQAWSDPRTCENQVQFEALVMRRVRKLLEASGGKRTLGPRPLHRIERLFLFMPYYSIEAWTYQNTVEAKRILHAEHYGQYIYRFDEWEAHRERLDEVLKPKAEIPKFEDRYNHRLASSGYPADAVYGVGKSFAALVDTMRRCEDLCAALTATRPPIRG